MTETPAALPGAAGVDDHESGLTNPQSNDRRPEDQELRPYQLDAIERIAVEPHRRILAVAPTGSGKTIIAAALIRDAKARGQRALFIDHRREITAQTMRRLFAVGIDAGTIQAGFPARPNEAVQVASIQTLHARAMRTSSLELPEADLLILDEAHHARARTWQAITDAYPNARIIGFTATPCRGDGRGLGNIFESLIEIATVAKLTSLGFLVPTKVYAPVRPDLSGIKIERGDYNERQLAVRVNTDALVGDIIEHWHKLSERRRTVIFAVDVAHSVHLRDEFRRSGVLAEHIDGSTPTEERDAILAKLVAGKIEIVTNCQVLTEGWDCPEVGCIVLARPTKSLGLYRQMTGRTLRPSLGKTDALVLDHAGAVFQHGFVDDPIEWTLSEDRRAENKSHTARGQYNAPALTTCPECDAVKFEGQPCTACGWHPVTKPRHIDIADGELGAVDRNRQVGASTYEERLRFHRQLIFIARERGYKDGWASHKYREKFGAWPSARNVTPLDPDPAVRAWVRSRQIAYAKAMSTARASS
jgi:DNA repair protein RadD